MVWNKPGANDQDFAADKYSCDRDVRQSGYYGTGLIGALNMSSFFKECMEGHGWSLERSEATETDDASIGDPHQRWVDTCTANCTAAHNLTADECRSSCSQ